jgi:hypothetical protein
MRNQLAALALVALTACARVASPIPQETGASHPDMHASSSLTISSQAAYDLTRPPGDLIFRRGDREVFRITSPADGGSDSVLVVADEPKARPVEAVELRRLMLAMLRGRCTDGD